MLHEKENVAAGSGFKATWRQGRGQERTGRRSISVASDVKQF
jgi:hypothetical protein